MKKRLLALVMAGVLAASMLSACGSSAGSKAAVETTADASSFDDLKATYGADVFEPNTDYELYTIIEYTIESAGATFAATVSKKADNSEYHIHCMFYGDEQVVVVDGDGNVTEDKTGFMETDGPLIVKAAEDTNLWAATK